MTATETASAPQLAAKRANAQPSTGPRTAEGKLASSANALSHGLTARNPLLPGENLEQYQEHPRITSTIIGPPDPSTTPSSSN